MQSDKLIKSFRLINSYKKLHKIVVLHFIQTKMFIYLKCHSFAGTYLLLRPYSLRCRSKIVKNITLTCLRNKSVSNVKNNILGYRRIKV